MCPSSHVDDVDGGGDNNGDDDISCHLFSFSPLNFLAITCVKYSKLCDIVMKMIFCIVMFDLHAAYWQQLIIRHQWNWVVLAYPYSFQMDEKASKRTVNILFEFIHSHNKFIPYAEYTRHTHTRTHTYTWDKIHAKRIISKWTRKKFKWAHEIKIK